MKLFKTMLLPVAAMAIVAVFNPSLKTVYAQCTGDTKAAVTCGTQKANGTAPVSANPTKSINDTIGEIVDLLSVGVGILAAVFIIIAGYKYITSNGDTAKLTSAKNTLLWAIVGIMVAASAQVIVRFFVEHSSP